MPRFIASHLLGPNTVTPAIVEESARHAKSTPEITCYRSFINMDQGLAVCILDAPSRQWLATYFKSINLPFDLLFEVQIESVNGHVRAPDDDLCPAAKA